ncbi:LysR family transcriptional regulator [Krasilnikovia sp. MM14-A1259]|uniref:LysR family transcriptional regulator n=1 Tax=Krasilnikovia sp. MM14-A1259 TaxID=3373539 RepID=UPI00382CAA49
MELRQLEHFVAAAEERHFTRAARRLHIAQSGLSASIQALERELGARLFLRSTRSVRLTAEGEALLAEARRTLAAADAARAAVAALTGVIRGRLTVGILQCYRPALPEALSAFHAAHPDVEIRLVQSASTTLLEQVIAGELDLAFVCPTGSRPGVRLTPLDDVPMVFVCSPQHPLAGRQSVRLDELADETFVDYPPGWGSRTVLDAFLTRHGLGRAVPFEVGDTDALLDLVAHGLGVAVVPSTVATAKPRQLCAIALAGPAPTFPTAAATPHQTSTAARILLDTVLTTVGRSPAAHQPDLSPAPGSAASSRDPAR